MPKLQKRTELVDLSYKWIEAMPIGKVFEPSDIYKFLELQYSDKIKLRGSADREQRFCNDARWAIDNAHEGRIIEHVEHGFWRRIAGPFDNITF